MLILLPPSEGKTAPTRGPVLNLSNLSFPGLAATRSRVLESLVQVCRTQPESAAIVLGLGPTQSGDVEANASLRERPCGPAIGIYTGVLFESLAYPSLSPLGRRRARRTLAISSGLWGLVRPTDLIPTYRLSGGVSLPGLGTLAAEWKAPVSAAIGTADGLILDLRSGTYSALGPVPRDAGARTATVRVLQERDGRRTVVSHFNKATKGRLVRALLEAPALPRDVDDFVDALADCGFRAERQAAGRAGRPTAVDVIVTDR